MTFTEAERSRGDEGHPVIQEYSYLRPSSAAVKVGKRTINAYLISPE